MKKFALIAALFISGFVSAQTLEDIMKAHDKAMGTLEKWQKLKTLKRSGKITSGGSQLSYVEQIENDKTRRLELSTASSSTITVVTEGAGWKQVGTAKPTALSAQEVKGGMKETVLVNDLLDYKKRGHTITLAGDDKSDGVFTHKIKLVKKSGETEYYFIDPKTFLLYKMATKKRINGQETDVQIYYSDYKFIAGIKLAQHIVIKDPLGDVIEDNLCEKMDANLVFNKLLFEKPQ